MIPPLRTLHDETWGSNGQINRLRVHHHIDDVPWFRGLLFAYDWTKTLDGPLFTVNLDRIENASGCSFGEYNSPDPAIPPLLAPTKYPAF
jgi:hypothetical protein